MKRSINSAILNKKSGLIFSTLDFVEDFSNSFIFIFKI